MFIHRIIHTADTVANSVANIAVDAKNTITENTSEPVRLAVVASGVYLTSRAAGFKAGHAYANTDPLK